MCSIEGDIEDVASCSKPSRNSLKRSVDKCKKCGEKPVLLLQKKDAFCKKCFFEYCDHKFRSTIGKTKKVKHGDKVLIAYSGGRKSAALLHMTQQALKSASLKQISFEPGILYIDESTVMPSNEENRHIIEAMVNTKYPALFSSIEMVHRINAKQEYFWSVENSSFNIPVCSESSQFLTECLQEMTLSAKQDFLKHLRYLLTTEIAKKAGYDFVFVGDSATSLAVDLLSSISLGRASQISSDTNFCDLRYIVPICRPIREFLNKEIIFYNHLHECPQIVLPNLLTKTDARSSVQRLTETFITNLQEDFPATVFTIFRTGGKLSTVTSSGSGVCVLCRSELDNDVPDAYSALEALKVSEKLTEKPASNVSDGIERIPSGPSSEIV